MVLITLIDDSSFEGETTYSERILSPMVLVMPYSCPHGSFDAQTKKLRLIFGLICMLFKIKSLV